ncbi:MAG: hypothetical protein LBD17_05370, partial [Endomicrobium sp.]|nr:hypothetical protein [Endomicrobium sp.]
MTNQEKSFLKRFVSNVDWYLILAVCVLMSISFTFIYSAGANYGMSLRYLSVQMLASGIGLVGLLLLASLNYQ